MFRDKKECITMLKRVLNSYSDFEIKAEEIRNCSDKIVKSFNSTGSLYGMYYPDPQFYKFFKYRGIIVTSDDDKFTYKYYYKGNKVYLTERYKIIVEDGMKKMKVEDYIFYFYFDNFVDIVSYYIDDGEIYSVGKVVYNDGKIHSFVQSHCILRHRVTSYKEYVFTNDEYLDEMFYGTFNECGKIIEVLKEKRHKLIMA